jgi:hypothetical protein
MKWTHMCGFHYKCAKIKGESFLMFNYGYVLGQFQKMAQILCKNVSKWNWTQGTLALDVLTFKTLMNNWKSHLGKLIFGWFHLGTTS